MWNTDGTPLATATFTSETQQGWQTVLFANPIAVTAGTTYIASYQSNGHYAVTSNYFVESHVSGLVTAPSSALVGGNGVYNYGSGANFPNATYGSSNYWVDVIYNQAPNVNPTAVADGGYLTGRDTPFYFDAAMLLSNDLDGNADPLSISSVTSAVGGSVVFDSIANVVTFTPTTGYTGPASFQYAISDGRGGASTATVSLTVQAGAVVAGVTLFRPTDRPAVGSGSDPNAVELGMKFTVSKDGTITGMRYYKSTRDTGVHVGTLWDVNGNALATATFTNETQSGWQTVTFSSEIGITAGATYIVSYQSNGYYAADANYFSTSQTNGPLTAPASNIVGGNGVYNYGTGANFPNSSYNSSNYWVDVVFEPAPNSPPTAVDDPGYTTTMNAAAQITAAALLTNDLDPDSDPLSVTGVTGSVHGTAVFDSQSGMITFTPEAGYVGSASFDYTVSDGTGTDTGTVSFTVNGAQTYESLFEGAAPAIISVNDPSSVELGMKFQADVDGQVTGIMFYKGPSNTGTHTGSIWTSTGNLLATATFTNETASGWQTATLDQPVDIEAGELYVVSYHTSGNYSATPGQFNAAVANDHLLAPAAGGATGSNGVYAYGSGSLFPTNSFNNTGYAVDVQFQTDPGRMISIGAAPLGAAGSRTV